MESAAVAQHLMRQIRERSGLTQAQLARRASLPRSVVNAYERGRREPGAQALAHLAAAAGLKLDLSPAPRPTRVDPVRAARILDQVLDLAESLPARRRGRLEFPPLPRHGQ